MWAVRLLEGLDLVVDEVHVERCCGVGEMVRLGRPDDGCSDDRVLQHPRQRDLSHRDAASFGDLLYRLDDGSVAFEIKSPSRRVYFLRARPTIASELP